MISKDSKRYWFNLFISNGGDDRFLYDFDLNENSVVYDIGSFDGEYFTSISKKYKCNIHAFEPVTSFYTDSIANLPPKVTLNNFALGSDSDDFDIALAGNSSSIFGTGEKVTCKKVKFVDYVKKAGTDRIDLLKVNCEGGEYELLDTIIKSEWLDKIDNIIIQFHTIDSIPEEERQRLVENICKTHTKTFSFPFVWEGFKLKV